MARPDIKLLIPTNPGRWGMRKRWGPMEPTVTAPKVETPMSVGQLENALRVAATEIFVKERRVSRVIFAARQEGEQTVTVDFHSASQRGQIVLLETTPYALEGSLDVNLALLNRDGIVTELTTRESMDYPALLTRLKELPQLRPVSHQRHF